jgi:hypothetical protein
VLPLFRRVIDAVILARVLGSPVAEDCRLPGPSARRWQLQIVRCGINRCSARVAARTGYLPPIYCG